MKRAVLVGIVAFSLGAMTAPRAANKNEALEVLCQRFKKWNGPGLVSGAWDADKLLDRQLSAGNNTSDAAYLVSTNAKVTAGLAMLVGILACGEGVGDRVKASRPSASPPILAP